MTDSRTIDSNDGIGGSILSKYFGNSDGNDTNKKQICNRQKSHRLPPILAKLLLKLKLMIQFLVSFFGSIFIAIGKKTNTAIDKSKNDE